MKILKEQLNKNIDVPPIRESNGYVNCVLALKADSQYDETNTYMSKWEVVNTVYYHANKNRFEGWIELEDVLPPREFL
jgi:hypothetical protein